MRVSHALIVIAAALAAALPLFGSSYQIYLAELIMINIVAAIGLNLLTGNCGQISLCHASLMAIGAYTTALLTTRFAVTYALALPTGIVVTTLLGASLGYPARRLSGLYLALVTLGFLEVVVDRHRGISRSHRRRSWAQTGEARARRLAPEYRRALLLCARRHRAGHSRRMGPAAFTLWPRFRCGPAKRDRGAGARPSRPRAPSSSRFRIAAAFAGLAGGLFTAVVGFIDPTEFDISASLREITFIAVGGLGSVRGSVVGAAALDAFARDSARREGV